MKVVGDEAAGETTTVAELLVRVPAELIALTENVYEPATVGVLETVPVEASKVKPAGNVPTTLYTGGGKPPAA
jgi:hypothetical protein